MITLWRPLHLPIRVVLTHIIVHSQDYRRFPIQIFEGNRMSTNLYGPRLQDRNIRLVRFTPADTANESTTLACQLLEASLDTPPIYYALSYVWGNPDSTDAVVCNGHRLRITFNLAKVLRRLQKGFIPPKATVDSDRRWDRQRRCWYTRPDADPYYLFWIDAICINQQSLMERNHQVQMMKEIYAQATGVIVWLGDVHHKNEDISAAMHAIKLFSPPPDRSRSHMTTSSLHIYMQDLEVSDVWSALNAIFASRWYQRLWCVQEVAVARESFLLFDNSCIHSQDVLRFGAWLTSVERDEPYGPFISFKPLSSDNLKELKRRINARKEYGGPLSVLSTFRSLEVKDPRDNIFGLLGLLKPEDSIFQVDYTESTAAVYMDVVLRLITHDRDLRVLSHVDHPAIRIFRWRFRLGSRGGTTQRERSCTQTCPPSSSVHRLQAAN